MGTNYWFDITLYKNFLKWIIMIINHPVDVDADNVTWIITKP